MQREHAVRPVLLIFEPHDVNNNSACTQWMDSKLSYMLVDCMKNISTSFRWLGLVLQCDKNFDVLKPRFTGKFDVVQHKSNDSCGQKLLKIGI